ncbi:MAG: hypothetical protein K6F28_05710 [Lachnospiraceae bacterium]|nr:hypothetical protein [Lachnospiraceae bacterium]
MRFGKSETELEKLLKRSLPQSRGSVLSRKYEGALMPDEGLDVQEKVSIIIDCGIDADEYAILSELLLKSLKDLGDYYKYSDYKVWYWKNNEIILHSPQNRSIKHLNRLRTYLKDLNVDEGDSGLWEDFKEIYKPARRDGLVLLLTTCKAVEQLKETKLIGVDKLVVLYYGNESSVTKMVVHNIPCIACKQRVLDESKNETKEESQ